MMPPPPMANGTFCGGMGRVMGPGFWFSPGTACVLFLFPGWNLDTPAKYAFGLIGAFLFGGSNEGLSWARRRAALSFKGRQRYVLSLLYALQMTMAYFMMLLVMTYEGGLIMCVIAGLACGHFVFSVLMAPVRAGKAVELVWGGEDGGHNSPCCGGAEIIEDEPSEKTKLINK